MAERIAIVLGKMDLAGVQAVVTDYYYHLDFSRYQYDFFIDRDSKSVPWLAITKLGGRVFLLPSVKRAFLYQKTLRRYLRDGGYSIAHVHLSTLSFLALGAAKKENVPVRILHNHSTSHKRETLRHLIKILCRPLCNRLATDYCACSRYAGEWMYGKKAVDSNEVKILPNAVSLTRFRFNLDDREAIRSALGVKDCFVVGCVGRMVKQKNQRYLIDVFSKCYSLNDKLRLVLVGEGKLKDKLTARVRKLGLTDGVVFIPPCADVEKYYSAFDCLCLPSLYEGLVRVAVEAQIAGLPVLCSTLIAEETDIGGEVTFIDLKNRRAWIERILSLAEGEKRGAPKERENAYLRFADGDYNIEIAAKKLCAFYGELLSKVSKDGEEKKGLEDSEGLPLISVLVPVYNVSEFLRQTVDGILNQSYKNLEIILADDGSTDGSGEICDEYLADGRVKVFHKENEGLAKTRNFLKERFSGEYALFVDGDDSVSPYHVENLYHATVKTRASLSCCHFLKYYGGALPVAKRCESFSVIDGKEYLRRVLVQKLECNAWGKLYSRELLGSLTYPNGSLYEDLAVTPALLDKIDSVCVVDSEDYIYRQNSSSILHKSFSFRDLDCLKFMEELKAYVAKEHEELSLEMNARYFSAVCNLFLRTDEKSFAAFYKALWEEIKARRGRVLKTKGVRLKNKCAALLSYFGKGIFKLVYKIT